MKFDKRIRSKLEGIDEDNNQSKSKKINEKNVKFEEEVYVGEPEQEIIPLELVNKKNQQHLGVVSKEQDLSDDYSDKIVRKLPNNQVEVYSPNMKYKITLKNVKAKIQSQFNKRMELDHIDKTINEMKKVPDFGYED